MSEEPLEVAWERVEAEWAEDEAHLRFISLCQVLGRLDEAGARYRAVREADPERADEAARRIDQVVARALATLHAQRVETPPKRNRRLLLLVAIGLFIGILGYTMWVIADAGSW
ncbi:MAG: hypothetical protein CMN30_08780 [Sandaracinus sp.]|nr:hypothetical protein [Sandaracinus sp.]